MAEIITKLGIDATGLTNDMLKAAKATDTFNRSLGVALAQIAKLEPIMDFSEGAATLTKIVPTLKQIGNHLTNVLEVSDAVNTSIGKMVSTGNAKNIGAINTQLGTLQTLVTELAQQLHRVTPTSKIKGENLNRPVVASLEAAQKGFYYALRDVLTRIEKRAASNITQGNPQPNVKKPGNVLGYYVAAKATLQKETTQLKQATNKFTGLLDDVSTTITKLFRGARVSDMTKVQRTQLKDFYSSLAGVRRQMQEVSFGNAEDSEKLRHGFQQLYNATRGLTNSFAFAKFGKKLFVDLQAMEAERLKFKPGESPQTAKKALIAQAVLSTRATQAILTKAIRLVPSPLFPAESRPVPGRNFQYKSADSGVPYSKQLQKYLELSNNFVGKVVQMKTGSGLPAAHNLIPRLALTDQERVSDLLKAKYKQETARDTAQTLKARIAALEKIASIEKDLLAIEARRPKPKKIGFGRTTETEEDKRFAQSRLQYDSLQHERILLGESLDESSKRYSQEQFEAYQKEVAQAERVALTQRRLTAPKTIPGKGYWGESGMFIEGANIPNPDRIEAKYSGGPLSSHRVVAGEPGEVIIRVPKGGPSIDQQLGGANGIIPGPMGQEEIVGYGIPPRFPEKRERNPENITSEIRGKYSFDDPLHKAVIAQLRKNIETYDKPRKPAPLSLLGTDLPKFVPEKLLQYLANQQRIFVAKDAGGTNLKALMTNVVGKWPDKLVAQAKKLLGKPAGNFVAREKGSLTIGGTGAFERLVQAADALGRFLRSEVGAVRSKPQPDELFAAQHSKDVLASKYAANPKAYILDIESAQTKPIEIAAKVVGPLNQTVEAMRSTLINSVQHLDDIESKRAGGINTDMLHAKGVPTLKEAGPPIARFLNKLADAAILTYGHSDKGWLEKATGTTVNLDRIVDMLTGLIKPLYPKGAEGVANTNKSGITHALQAMRQYMELPEDSAHRAPGDVNTTGRVLEVALDKLQIIVDKNIVLAKVHPLFYEMLKARKGVLPVEEEQVRFSAPSGLIPVMTPGEQTRSLTANATGLRHDAISPESQALIDARSKIGFTNPARIDFRRPKSIPHVEDLDELKAITEEHRNQNRLLQQRLALAKAFAPVKAKYTEPLGPALGPTPEQLANRKYLEAQQPVTKRGSGPTIYGRGPSPLRITDQSSFGRSNVRPEDAEWERTGQPRRQLRIEGPRLNWRQRATAWWAGRRGGAPGGPNGPPVVTQTGQPGGRGRQGISLGNLTSQMGMYAMIGGLYKFNAQIKGSIDKAADFSISLAQIQTISEQATQMGIGPLGDEVTKVSKKWAMPVPTTSKALYNVISDQMGALEGGGESFSKSVQFLEDSAKFGRAAIIPIDDSAQILASIANSYDMGAGAAQMIGAQLFRTIDIGRVTGDQLKAITGRLMPLGAEVGAKPAELLGALAKQTIEGIKPEESTTLISNMLLKLIKPTEDLQAEFDRLGISSVKLGIQGRGVEGFLAYITEHGGTAAESVSKLFKQIRATRSVLSLVGKEDAAKYIAATTAIRETKIVDLKTAYEKVSKVPGLTYEEVKAEFDIFWTAELGPQMLEVVNWISKTVGPKNLGVAAAGVGIVGTGAVTVASLGILGKGLFDLGKSLKTAMYAPARVNAMAALTGALPVSSWTNFGKIFGASAGLLIGAIATAYIAKALIKSPNTAEDIQARKDKLKPGQDLERDAALQMAADEMLTRETALKAMTLETVDFMEILQRAYNSDKIAAISWANAVDATFSRSIQSRIAMAQGFISQLQNMKAAAEEAILNLRDERQNARDSMSDVIFSRSIRGMSEKGQGYALGNRAQQYIDAARREKDIDKKKAYAEKAQSLAEQGYDATGDYGNLNSILQQRLNILNQIEGKEKQIAADAAAAIAINEVALTNIEKAFSEFQALPMLDPGTGPKAKEFIDRELARKKAAAIIDTNLQSMVKPKTTAGVKDLVDLNQKLSELKAGFVDPVTGQLVSLETATVSGSNKVVGMLERIFGVLISQPGALERYETVTGQKYIPIQGPDSEAAAEVVSDLTKIINAGVEATAAQQAAKKAQSTFDIDRQALKELFSARAFGPLGLGTSINVTPEQYKRLIPGAKISENLPEDTQLTVPGHALMKKAPWESDKELWAEIGKTQIDKTAWDNINKQVQVFDGFNKIDQIANEILAGTDNFDYVGATNKITEAAAKYVDNIPAWFGSTTDAIADQLPVFGRSALELASLKAESDKKREEQELYPKAITKYQEGATGAAAMGAQIAPSFARPAIKQSELEAKRQLDFRAGRPPTERTQPSAQEMILELKSRQAPVPTTDILNQTSTLGNAAVIATAPISTLGDVSGISATSVSNLGTAAGNAAIALSTIQLTQSGYAKGGDVVQASLTPGEFVMNPRATQQWYPTIKAMNRFDQPRFAEGGDVTNVGDVVVNINGSAANRVDGRQIAHAIRRTLRQKTARLS